MLHIHCVPVSSCPRMSGTTWTSWDVPMLHIHCIPGPSCPRMSGTTWDIPSYRFTVSQVLVVTECPGLLGIIWDVLMLQSQDVWDNLMSPCYTFTVSQVLVVPGCPEQLGISWDIPMLQVHCILGPSCPRTSRTTWDILGCPHATGVPECAGQLRHPGMSPRYTFTVSQVLVVPGCLRLLGTSWDVSMLSRSSCCWM